jgi:hypothetical protein
MNAITVLTNAILTNAIFTNSRGRIAARRTPGSEEAL